MPIPLSQPHQAGSPVLKRRQIGEQFVGGLIAFDQRDMLKDGNPVRKDNGKNRQELVVTLLTYQSTMATTAGDVVNMPARGQVVRIILRGGAFGQWIEAKNAIRDQYQRELQVGDLVQVTTTHATRYESTGANRELGDITTPQDLDQYYQTSMAYRDRRESLGFRGGLSIQPCPAEMAQFGTECEGAYQLHSASSLPDDLEQAPQQQAAPFVPQVPPPHAVPAQQPMPSGYVDPRAPQQQPSPFNPAAAPPAPVPVAQYDQNPFDPQPAPMQQPAPAAIPAPAAAAPAPSQQVPAPAPAQAAPEPNPIDGLFGN